MKKSGNPRAEALLKKVKGPSSSGVAVGAIQSHTVKRAKQTTKKAPQVKGAVMSKDYDDIEKAIEKDFDEPPKRSQSKIPDKSFRKRIVF